MLLVGDVHGLFWNYMKLIEMSHSKKSLQLGDFGLGFPNGMNHVDMNHIEGTHLFLRGNHDNPEVCRKSSNYIGDYGILDGSFIDGAFDKLFYISGAWSIDRITRIPNYNWWENEELSYKQLCDMVNFYFKEKPDIVCSHDCPTTILKHLYDDGCFPTRTGQAFDAMLNHHVPSYWFFGHHHKTWKKEIGGCLYTCLNELETLDISKRIIQIGE